MVQILWLPDDLGIRYVGRMLKDSAVEVVFIRYRIIQEVAAVAPQEGVDIIGLSFCSTGAVEDITVLMGLLRKQHMEDLQIIVGGNTLLHTRIIARKVAEMGFDYISLSAGGKFEDLPSPTVTAGRILYYGGYSRFRMAPTADVPERMNVYLAEDIKNVLRRAGYSTPVMTTGRIPHPRLAEAILAKAKPI